MGIFGHPELHEDDALRALRAASALRADLPGARTGVDTGVVLAQRRVQHLDAIPAIVCPRWHPGW